MPQVLFSFGVPPGEARRRLRCPAASPVATLMLIAAQDHACRRGRDLNNERQVSGATPENAQGDACQSHDPAQAAHNVL